jgi:hypothetical protein
MKVDAEQTLDKGKILMILYIVYFNAAGKVLERLFHS